MGCATYNDAMLSSWLAGSDLETFLRDTYRRAPFAQSDTAASAVRSLSWQTIMELLSSPAAEDMLVVRRGSLLTTDIPQTFRDLRQRFEDGWSVVFRRCERYHAGLARLAGSWEKELPGSVNIQVFATPQDTSSFGWHYDCEDVFIVQTSGSKEYMLRENTVNPAPTIDAMPRDMEYEKENSTLKMTCTLRTGDWLYIPRGFWHRARGIEDSLSISIGVLGADARGSRVDIGAHQRHDLAGEQG